MEKQNIQKNYYSFFSTYANAVTSDPKAMVVPVDDHGFHRGDGVFEALKWTNHKIWLLTPHLDRLQQSAQKIGITLPLSRQNLETRIHDVLSMAAMPKGLLRIFVTRGPGSFGVSPYESTAPQIYIVATELKEWTDQSVMNGVSIMRSSLVAKKGLFAQVKSLNYLPNVLMKKEAIDSGFDFSIGVGEQGEILESSTENLGFIKGKKIVTPLFDSTLRGTSLIRLTQLIAEHVHTDDKLLWESRSFDFQELISADEVFLVGTTIDVLPVTRIEEYPKIKIEQSMRLRHLLQSDQK